MAVGKDVKVIDVGYSKYEVVTGKDNRGRKGNQKQEQAQARAPWESPQFREKFKSWGKEGSRLL